MNVHSIDDSLEGDFPLREYDRNEIASVMKKNVYLLQQQKASDLLLLKPALIQNLSIDGQKVKCRNLRKGKVWLLRVYAWISC
jgi:hypothetical protein